MSAVPSNSRFPGRRTPPTQKSERQGSSPGKTRRISAACGGHASCTRTTQIKNKQINVKEFNRKLQEIKAQTRILRSREAQLRVDMDRKDIDACDQHRADEERTIRNWRQEQSKLMLKVEADRRREQREIEIQASRKFQEEKRVTRQVAQEEDVNISHCSYIESKENAQFNTNRKRIELINKEKDRVEDNLEKYRFFAEYQAMEKEYQKEEEQIFRNVQQQSKAEDSMASALKECELALQQLECTENMGMNKDVQVRTRTGTVR